MKTIAVALVAFAAIPAAASAQSYDLQDYGNANFTYGSGTGGSSFTQFTTNNAGGCFGSAQLACQTNGGNDTVPATVFNNGPGTVHFANTVDLPENVLLLHPGYGTNNDAILRFTATTTATYDLSGVFSRLDDRDGGGDGVNVGIFLSNGQSIYSGSLANSPQGVSTGFGTRTRLTAGQYVDFVVNNGNGAQPGGTFYDSTGLVGTIAAGVPEPTTWSLMILGFGAVGGAMRRRARTTTTVAYA